MSEILSYIKENSQKYEHRVITVKQSLLPTQKQEHYALMIKVARDRMFGRIGLADDPTFSLTHEVPLTGELEHEAAKEMEQNLIEDLKNAILERDL